MKWYGAQQQKRVLESLGQGRRMGVVELQARRAAIELLSGGYERNEPSLEGLQHDMGQATLVVAKA